MPTFVGRVMFTHEGGLCHPECCHVSTSTEEYQVMENSKSSPFSSAFQSAVRRGTPCSVAVANIAKRQNKTANQVYQSLYKACVVNRQKINGQWVYWAVQARKSTGPVARQAQAALWQSYVDWALANGHTTPEKIADHMGSRSEFQGHFKRFFAKQFAVTQISSRSSMGRALPCKGRCSSSTRRYRRAA